MKLVAISSLPVEPANTGGKRRIVEVLKHFKKIEAILIAPKPLPKKIKSYCYSGMHLPKICLTNLNILNCIIPWNLIRIFRILNKINPDYIQAEGIHAFFTAYLFSCLKRKKTIIVIHNIEHIVAEQSNRNKLFVRFLYLYEHFCYKKSDLLVTMSKQDKERISKIFNINPEKIIIVPNGANIHNRYRNKINKGTDILFTGKLDYIPNNNAVKFILEKIAPKILRKFPNTYFKIIGSPKINTNNNHILSLGYVEDIDYHMENSDICIAPVFEGSGTRLKILEYMANGRPVVSTSIAAEGINGLQHKKNILIADDLDQFVKNISDLIKNPKIRRSIGNSAKNLIKKHYTWKKIAEDYEIFLMMLNENGYKKCQKTKY